MTTARLGVADGSRPIGLPTPQQAKLWEEVAPGTFDRIMGEIEREEQHRRDLDIRDHRILVAEFYLRAFGHVCGLLTVGIFALLAKHFADTGAPSQGAWIMGTAAVSIVGIFITGRLAQARTSAAPARSLDAQV